MNKFFPIFAPGCISIPVKNLENCEMILAMRSNLATEKNVQVYERRLP